MRYQVTIQERPQRGPKTELTYLSDTSTGDDAVREARDWYLSQYDPALVQSFSFHNVVPVVESKLTDSKKTESNTSKKEASKKTESNTSTKEASKKTASKKPAPKTSTKQTASKQTISVDKASVGATSNT